ncbi:MAG: hypothetical protein A3A31_00675, partial [Candidatus Zambryskibacteria bacterium RIFCSPLOWO2_01_FULL_48_25]
MQVPSGAKYTNEDLDILAMMSKCGFVRRSDEPFKLASGIMSHVYVFGREDLTDNPQLASLIGLKLARVVYDNTDLDESRQQCLIGVPVAGNTLAQAASLSSLSLLKEMAWTAQPIGHRVMREQPKQHGAHKKVWINGRPDLARHQYWWIDNVVTDGRSKVVAAERGIEDGYPGHEMPCLIWIDRQQGAVPRLTAAGFQKIVVVYNLLDITYAYGELGMW